MKVSDILTQQEILAQVAEEASELSHASLKLRRALDDINPTDGSIMQAIDNLIEEVADVRLCVNQLRCVWAHENHIIQIMREKELRWLNRLFEAEKRRKDNEDDIDEMED